MKKTILIIDDEQDIVEVLTECVQHMGHTVISAHDGVEGFEVASTQNPDLIISDINMPRLDGIKLLEKLKANKVDAPVILFTAYSDTQKIKQAWKLGAFDFVEKPIDLNALQGLIEKAVQFGDDFKANPIKSNLLKSTIERNVELKLPVDLYDSLLKKSKEENTSIEKYIIKLLEA